MTNKNPSIQEIIEEDRSTRHYINDCGLDCAKCNEKMEEIPDDDGVRRMVPIVMQCPKCKEKIYVVGMTGGSIVECRKRYPR